MKLLLIYIIVLLFSACRSGKEEQLIPGTYIRFSQHEYGTEYDTIKITLQNSSANEYRILRKWKYERIVDGEKIEPEYKRTIYSGIYDAKYKLLQETETGDIYSFDFRAGILFNGPIKYQKL